MEILRVRHEVNPQYLTLTFSRYIAPRTRDFTRRYVKTSLEVRELALLLRRRRQGSRRQGSTSNRAHARAHTHRLVSSPPLVRHVFDVSRGLRSH
eukprot:9169975-Pyramimonas_sp.AAC.1